jgi:hypothetical protein
MSSSARPLCAMPPLSRVVACFVSPEYERAAVHDLEVVHLATLELAALVGGRGELPLGQAVHAVVLDHVHHVEVAAQDVAVLADADRGGVAVAADTNDLQTGIAELRPGRQRRHAAVHRVEAHGLGEEVGRRLAGAADAGRLHHVVGVDAHLVVRADDVARDRVVAAADAERRRQAAVVGLAQADAVLRRCGRGSRGGIRGCVRRRHVRTLFLAR